MDKRYKHLNSEERGVILAEYRRRASLREIGGLLGRSASTIGRELRRGRPDGLPAQPYCAQRGGTEYRARRKHSVQRRKIAPGGWLHDFVRGKLIHQRWSAEQIARKLKAIHPEDPTRQISHEAIYAAIYAQPRGGLKQFAFDQNRGGIPIGLDVRYKRPYQLTSAQTREVMEAMALGSFARKFQAVQQASTMSS